MADVPDIKLIRTDTTLDLDIWAKFGRAEAKVPCPYLLSKVLFLQLYCLIIYKTLLWGLHRNTQ